MNTTYRTSEILEAMPSFSKTLFRKAELLPELMNLQSELVAQTFNGTHAENANLRIWDVENHLQHLNEERGNVADAQLAKFKDGCKIICNSISGEISGIKGERKAFRSLETLRCKHRVLKNVELSMGSHRTELDAVVLTDRAIFVIEVKNTAKDILIDERGNYCLVNHVKDSLFFDKNIGERMNGKTYLLREALLSAGYEDPNIVSLVVFTNSGINVENRFRHIVTCFLADLPHFIDKYPGRRLYYAEDFDKMADAVELAKSTMSYPLPIDIAEFKKTFADLLVTLETASDPNACEAVHSDEVHNEPVHCVPKRDRKKFWSYLAGAAACVFVPVAALGLAKLAKN